MNILLEKLTEIFEEDNLDLTLRVDDYDSWDSLTVLSIIAMLDSDYGINLTKKELEDFENIGSLCNYILQNAK